MTYFYLALNLLPIIGPTLAFGVGVFMIIKFYKKGGLLTPPVLSGIAFVLVTFPTVVGLILLLLRLLGVHI